MKYSISQCDSAPCSEKKFYINGVQAYLRDFGSGEDKGGDIPYCGFIGCINYKFTAKDPSPDVLEKYFISEKEYWEIAEYLEGLFSFGSCEWCS